MTINDYYQHRDKVSSYKEPFFEFTYQDAISYLSYIFCISGLNTNPYLKIDYELLMYIEMSFPNDSDIKSKLKLIKELIKKGYEKKLLTWAAMGREDTYDKHIKNYVCGDNGLIVYNSALDKFHEEENKDFGPLYVKK